MECLKSSLNSSINCSSNASEDGFLKDAGWRYPEYQATTKNVILAVVLTTIVIVSIFGNLLVLMAFVLEKRLLQPFNMYICNLAVTDFLVAITAMTFYTIDTLLGYWPFGKIMCGVWIYFDFAMTFASVFTLVAISIDRFWCVTWVIHYKVHNNRFRTGIFLGVIWFCVVAIWTPPFVGDRMKHSEEHFCIWEPSNNRDFVLFVAVIGHYTPCLIMVFAYIKVFMTMRRQAIIVGSTDAESNVAVGIATSKVIRINVIPVSNERNGTIMDTEQKHARYSNDNKLTQCQLLTTEGCGASNHSSPPPSTSRCTHSSILDTDHTYNSRSQQRRAPKTTAGNCRERRIFVTLTFVVGSYLICWFPFYIAFDTYAWAPDFVPADLYTFFFWMTYFNSTLNPFIYAYTNKEFRLAFIKVIKCLCRCKR